MCKFNLLRISVLVSLILCLCLTVSFGQEKKQSRPRLDELIRQTMQKDVGKAPRRGAQEKEAEAEEELKEFEEELEADAEPEDPNKPLEPFERIVRGGKSEMREWLFGNQEDRLALAKQVQSQVIQELNYIRKAAEAEGAEQTIAAIDKVTANRKERFDSITKRILEARAKATQNQSTDTRQGVRGRGATGTGRGQPRGQEGLGPRGRIYQGQGQRGSGTRQNGN
jgi:hypothetical protein